MTIKSKFFSGEGRKWLFLIALASFSASLCAQIECPRKFRLPQELREVSGLVVAGPDSLWWHNDGGNSSDLFLTDREGNIEKTVPLPTAINYDWEDLTYDDTGRLYVGDFGDNRYERTDLQVYRYDLLTEELDSLQFSYPNDERYNVEAFFWHRDSLHLFTKSSIRRACLATYHFVVPATVGHHTAEFRDSLLLKKRVVTAAAVHPETGQVALLAYYFKLRLGFLPYSAANVYYLTDYPEGHFLRGKMQSRRISCFVATQYESLDFLTPEFLLVASEQTLFIKPKAKRVRWKD